MLEWFDVSQCKNLQRWLDGGGVEKVGGTRAKEGEGWMGSLEKRENSKIGGVGIGVRRATVGRRGTMGRGNGKGVVFEISKGGKGLR